MMELDVFNSPSHPMKGLATEFVLTRAVTASHRIFNWIKPPNRNPSHSPGLFCLLVMLSITLRQTPLS